MLSKKNLSLILFFAAAGLLSSCNRGYGCPSQMSSAVDWLQSGGVIAGALSGLF